MNWDDARFCDMICWQAVLDDAPRGSDRAKIANVANGLPPYTAEEVAENQIEVNVNFLEMTKSLQEARLQFSNAFLKQGNFFRCATDYGSPNKRQEYSATVTTSINRILKRSIQYFESYRAKGGLVCLHGIAPVVYDNEDKWLPQPRGIGDVLMPGDTLLGFENLPRFIIRKSWTSVELYKLTRASKRDPGWNMPMVERCLTWLESQMANTVGNRIMPAMWAPEKIAERQKQGTNWSIGDVAPVIDTFDCYFYDEDAKEPGWIRRIILDTWGNPNPGPGPGSYALSRDANTRDLEPTDSGDFLFNSGTRIVGKSWQNIINFQFADLSAVAPFRYHSVRSLGYLLFAVCSLQNRLRCKFNEALFENLMMLFRVKSQEDVQHALKLDMYNRGFIDDSLSIVPAAERFQPRMDFVELGLTENSKLISSSTGAYAQRADYSQPQNVEKTRFQVMAEVNAGTAMISSALQQAYKYQNFEDQEIFRRFLKPNSTDPDVRAFQGEILRKGVPEKCLDPEAWDIDHEQVMGGGNKTMEMSIAQQLLEMRPMFDPQPQRQILHDVVLAITDDAARADSLVPKMPTVSDSVHDTELAFGALMQGSQVTPKPGLNAMEVAGTTLRLMAQKLQMTGPMGTPQDVMGLQAAAQYAGGFIQQLSQDKTQMQVAKQLGDMLGKVMNEVKALTQRIQEQMQAAQQNGNGQPDPQAVAKAQAIQMQAQVKAQSAKESHAQKTAQRMITFEQKTKQDAQKHAQQLRQQATKEKVDIAAKDLETASEISRNRLKAASEPKTKPPKK